MFFESVNIFLSFFEVLLGATLEDISWKNKHKEEKDQKKGEIKRFEGGGGYSFPSSLILN